jgi:site-specific DNA-methyltransferase (adenine-specific)
MNEVWQGDCLEVMKRIEDKSIDLILADLPYGTTACKWDKIIPFEPLWTQYKRIIKDNGAIVLTASQPFTSALVMSNVNGFKYSWIWNKKQTGNHFLAKYQPLKIHEDVLVFNSKNYRPEMRTGKMRTKGGAKKSLLFGSHTTESVNDQYYPTSVIEIANERLNKLHPTQKPVALFEYLIKTYTNEGDLVLDNCAGSGTTGVACKNLNRNFILIEKEQEYIDIIHSRLSSVVQC